MIADVLLHAVACVLLAIEVAAGCHCAIWTNTPHGPRCSAPLDYPKCELIAGWHPIAFGINTCTKGACDAE